MFPSVRGLIGAWITLNLCLCALFAGENKLFATGNDCGIDKNALLLDFNPCYRKPSHKIFILDPIELGSEFANAAYKTAFSSGNIALSSNNQGNYGASGASSEEADGGKNYSYVWWHIIIISTAIGALGGALGSVITLLIVLPSHPPQPS